MIRRPKKGENEEDLLRMQEEFLREKSAPSAQVVNLRKTEHQTTKRTNSSTSERKQSKYAKSKGLQNSEKRTKVENSTGSVFGDIMEKNVSEEQQPERAEFEDDKVYYPKVLPFVLGDIVEKSNDDFLSLDFKMTPQGFPAVVKNDFKLKPTPKKGSFPFKKLGDIEEEKMDIDIASGSHSSSTSKLNIPNKSYILKSNEANAIHSENVNMLSKMTEEEILSEQHKLLSSLDPKLVDFIKSVRKPSNTNQIPLGNQSQNQEMDISEPKQEQTSKVVQENDLVNNDTLWESDVLSHPHINQWIHFNDLEKEKMEWMKGIEESKKIKPNEPFEARFDFKGYLLPYTMEYTEETKTLFHHGEEPHRPGYSITELIELSRSTIIQQRVMALNTIAGLLEYYISGFYKDVIEVPLSKLFFVIRIAMDENKTILLQAALKAMRNLLYNRIDEACLDALLGFEEGSYQPCLENNKSEISEIESEESELKDFHLAEIDLLSAVLRTDILQRLYYILECVRPSFDCVQYSLQILTRISRDSIEASQNIVNMEHLMNSIIQNFVPTTSVNFSFGPNIVYSGKPILSALKLIRILSLQNKDIGEILITKYNILEPLSEYIRSGVDGTYGLRLQVEAFSILSNLINYGLGVDKVFSLFPIIITTIYKHVQGTDIFISSSIISVQHAAVVLQLLNKMFNCPMINLDNYKEQAYPLLKEGLQKWLMQTATMDEYTCGHLRLLCSALDCCKTVLINEKVTLKFLNDSLKTFVSSKGFKNIIKNLVPSSNLVSNIDENDLNSFKNLVSLGGSIIDSTQKVLPILNILSPIPVLVSLFKLLNIINDINISKLFLEQLTEYLTKLSKKEPSLCSNWFTRMEIDFVFNIVKLHSKTITSESSKDLIYSVSSTLCYILRVDKKSELDYLFNNIIYNKDWFTAERLLNIISLSEDDGIGEVLVNVDDIKACYTKVINANKIEISGNIVLKEWRDPVLPRDWIYLPILSLYSSSQATPSPEVIGEHAIRVKQQIAAEKEMLVKCSLQWIVFNEMCFPDLLKDIDITDRFCRIMCVYLCDNSLFLDKTIQVLLKKCIQLLFRKGNDFNFDKQLTGLNNFQDFYTQFLEQFQSVSYGDPIFAACVLVPLAQRHNVKWRKLLWSEYAGCLRALDCPESYLCYEFNEYLCPEETDESLIKSYFRALSSNLLRSNTIAYRIANHHVNSYKKRINK
ncbi:unnamed protein product [Danaus chrysippus]|uniref:(African queen) hypothetical protein n=1 Tax=Danaus chrysippus TaxID=151541 RepID=A0A8J2MJ11_9NEOP|nr:unnamed protein product [Danaus chrysippus]